MGNLIHDKVERVRLAVVQLLLKIKTIPNIKYYHIVPLEHLTARFIEEAKVRHPSKSVVAAALTSLMINSYFPEHSNTTTSTTVTDPSSSTTSSSSNSTHKNTEPVRRALQFCTDEPEAAVVFYAHVSKYRSFTSIVQLVVQLFRCLYNTTMSSSKSDSSSEQRRTSVLTAAMKRRRRLSQSKTQDDTSTTESTSPSPPIEVLATIAEVIRTLWESIATKLQQNDKWNTFVLDEFSGPKLTSIFSYYDNLAQTISTDDDADTESLLTKEDCYRICSAIVSCAGRLPSESASGLTSNIIQSIQHEIQFSVPFNVHTSNSSSYVTALICNWDMTDKIVTSFASTIRSSLYKIVLDDTNQSFLLGSPIASKADSKKRRSGRSIATSKSRNTIDDGDTLTFPQLPASVVINVLNEIFVGADPCSASARDVILSSPKAVGDLEQLFHDGIKCLGILLDPIQSDAISVRILSRCTCEVHYTIIHSLTLIHFPHCCSIRSPSNFRTWFPYVNFMDDLHYTRKRTTVATVAFC